MLIYHRGLAISPWYRLVLGIVVILLRVQPALFFCVSIYFISIYTFYFICLFVLFSLYY